MLRLDYAQRTKGPLDPKLRAKMRWVIAHANRCEYSQQTALADLKRSGGSDEEIAALTGDAAAWPEADRAPLRFAREHTLIAPQIEDHLLLESVVQNDADGIQAVLQNECESRDQKERRETLRPALHKHLVDYQFRDRREDNHHQCP
jgi:alkylhydroperoxidase family enzyme